MWTLKYKINKQNGNKLTDTENKLTVATWEGLGGCVHEGKGLRGPNLQSLKTATGM